jgi:hypothetical protein
MALLLFITKLSASVPQYPRELMPASMRRPLALPGPHQAG